MKKFVLVAVLMMCSLNLQAETGQTALFAGMGMYGGDSNTIPDATFYEPNQIAINSINND